MRDAPRYWSDDLAAGRAAAAAPLVAVVAVEVGADGGRAGVRLAVLAPGAERVAGEVEAHPVGVEGEDDEDLAAVDEAAHDPVAARSRGSASGAVARACSVVRCSRAWWSASMRTSGSASSSSTLSLILAARCRGPGSSRRSRTRRRGRGSSPPPAGSRRPSRAGCGSRSGWSGSLGSAAATVAGAPSGTSERGGEADGRRERGDGRAADGQSHGTEGARPHRTAPCRNWAMPT